MRQLTASIVNVTVGAGIFVLPAAVAAQPRAPRRPPPTWSAPWRWRSIVTSFALAGSRVSLTGGIYAYVEVAFGPFVGVLAGVVQWLVLWLTAAGLLSAFADQVGLLVPGAGRALARVAVILATLALLAFVNVRGVKPGARLVEGITVAKLLPLALLIGVGVFSHRPRATSRGPAGPAARRSAARVLLLIFAFAGIEVALVPSGEVREPERTVPRAIGLALGVTTLLYLAIQAVAQGVLGGELQQNASAPLAAAAGRLLGDWGRLLVLLGGTRLDVRLPERRHAGLAALDLRLRPRRAAAAASSPRCTRASAPRTSRSPPTRCSSAALAATQHLHAPGAALERGRADALLPRLRGGAALRLRVPPPRAPRALRLPGERVIPIAAMAVILWILAHATARELAVLGATLAAATLLYAAAPRPHVKLHLVDGTYELFRAFYGVPPAHDAQGRPVGALRGLVSTLIALVREPGVSTSPCAFDHVIESFRNQLFAGYKTGDGIEPDLLAQFHPAERAVAALGIVVWPMVEFEADDALATGGRALSRRSGRRAGGDLLARQGPLAVRGRPAGHLPRPPARHRPRRGGRRGALRRAARVDPRLARARRRQRRRHPRHPGLRREGRRRRARALPPHRGDPRRPRELGRGGARQGAPRRVAARAARGRAALPPARDAADRRAARGAARGPRVARRAARRARAALPRIGALELADRVPRWRAD